MPDQKLSLEDILNEYSPENQSPKTQVGRVDAQFNAKSFGNKR